MSGQSEYLRPRHAVARFGISRSTLDRWAKRGLIGKSTVEGTVYLNADDIRDVIAAHEERRTVVPMASPTRQPVSVENDWRAYFATAPRPTASRAKKGKAT